MPPPERAILDYGERGGSMAKKEAIAGDHPIGNVGVDVRLVIRRMRMTPRRIDEACREGRFPTGGSVACCELVANGTVIATGVIEKRDREVWFCGGETT
jgi:hypothetical protein